MYLLLVEDDVQLASFLSKGLREGGFNVDIASDGEEAIYMVKVNNYDLLVVDIMLPKKNGFEVIEEVRKMEKTMPILILSAKQSVDEKVKGLTTGSDDYLTKPFAFVELLARIRALLRRSQKNIHNDNKLAVCGLVLDPLTRNVFRGDCKIDLKPKEFSILQFFMRHPGQIVTRTMLIEQVWGMQFDPGTNVIDVHICHLRDKIDKPFKVNTIHTIRGVGYVLQNAERA